MISCIEDKIAGTIFLHVFVPIFCSLLFIVLYSTFHCFVLWLLRICFMEDKIAGTIVFCIFLPTFCTPLCVNV